MVLKNLGLNLLEIIERRRIQEIRVVPKNITSIDLSEVLDYMPVPLEIGSSA